MKLKLTDFKLCLFIFSFGLILYIHTLSFDLVYYDDHILVFDNRYYLENIKNIFFMFKTDAFLDRNSNYYRPLLNLSLMLDSLIKGPGFFIFHLTNILLHALSGILLFKLLRKLNGSQLCSLGLSLLFLSHPTLMVTAVWIPGRNDLLLFIFIVLSMLNFINYIQSKLNKYFIYSLLFFALSLLTKETAIVLPLLFIFYVYFQRVNIKTIFPFLLSTLIVILAWWLVRQNVLENNSIEFTKEISTSFKLIMLFLGKTIFQLNSQLWLPKDSIEITYGCLVLLLTLPLIYYSAKTHNKIALFGVLWYLFFLSPFLVLKLYYHQAASWEQKLYLPFAGLMIFISSFEHKSFRLSNFLKVSISIIFLLYFMISSIIYSLFFENEILFWEKVVNDFPDNINALKNTGYIYHMNKNYITAEVYYKKVLSLNPKETFVHHNLGIIYAKRNEKEKANREFELELKNNPDYIRYMKFRDKSNIKLLVKDFNFLLEK